jgi:hypothetical protein
MRLIRRKRATTGKGFRRKMAQSMGVEPIAANFGDSPVQPTHPLYLKCMSIHDIVMEVTAIERGKKQVNIAQATSVIHTFGHMLARRSILKALWIAFCLRRAVK